jgi:tyrosyl-tRNA synthetase
VHGDEQVRRAEHAAAVLFSGDLADAEIDEVLMVFEDAPSSELTLSTEGIPLADLLATVKLTSSKSEAARLVKSGGVYVNNVRATDERRRLTPADAIRGELFILRKGRKEHHLVKLRRS